MHRSRLRLVLAASLACLLVLAAPGARAQGPVIPVPVAVKPTWVLRHLVESGVRIPREQAMAALQAYADGLEQATVQAIDGGKGALSGSVDDVRRRQDLANRAADAATRLRNELFDALAAAARPEDRPVVDAVRAHEAVQAAGTEVQGQAGVILYRMPDDFGGWLMPMGKWTGTPDEYRHRVLLAATNADSRVAALAVARKRVAEAELDALRNPPAERTVKVKRPDGTMGTMVIPGQPSRVNPLETGTDAGDRLLRVQLDAYRTILPQLTPGERSELRRLWVPRMLGIDSAPRGIPPLMTGSHAVGPYVTEILCTGGLDDAARDEIRRIGRAWVKDDDALIDDAMKRMVETGKRTGLSAQRDARMAQARQQFAAVKGLEWLAVTDRMPSWPLEGLTEADDADVREFGRGSGARVAAAYARMEKLPEGFPPGWSADSESQLADLLRLDDAQRAVLASVVADARARWEAEVRPLVVAAAPVGARQMVYDEAALAKLDEAMRRSHDAMVKAWSAATAIDDATFDALRAGLGERFDAGGLALARAARESRRFREFSFRPEPRTVMLADRILSTPVTAQGRAAAIAATAPLIPGWIDTLRAAHAASLALDASQLATRGQRAQPRVVGEPTGEPDPSVAAAEQAKDELRTRSAAADAVAQRIEDAVVAALAGEDQARMRQSLALMHGQGGVHDLRPFWRGVDATIAALPADRRAADGPAIAALSAGVLACDGRLATALAALPAAPASYGDPDPARPARWLATEAVAEAVALAGARMDALLPVDKRIVVVVRNGDRPDDVYALRTWLARLAGDPAAAALQPPAVPARMP
jgi:hypothetical protein